MRDCRVSVSVRSRHVERDGLVGQDDDIPPLSDADNINVVIGRLVRHVEVEGELTKAEVERLREIAVGCPVSVSIGPAIPIRTSIAQVGAIRQDAAPLDSRPS